MKKHKKIVLIAIIAIAVAIISFVGGRAYAKYMSKVTGNGTAEVASWSFKVNNSSEKMQNISLNSTLNNEKIINKKIAPGTSGNFQIKLDGAGSDVGINYSVRFENATTKPTNLKFIYNGKTYDSLATLQEQLNGSFNANSENKTQTFNIGWEWKYETGKTVQEIATNDKIDTNEAKQIKNYSFDIVVSGTQINPNNN